MHLLKIAMHFHKDSCDSYVERDPQGQGEKQGGQTGGRGRGRGGGYGGYGEAGVCRDTRHETWEKEEAKMPIDMWPEQPKEWGYQQPCTELRTMWGKAGLGRSRVHLNWSISRACCMSTLLHVGPGSLGVKNLNSWSTGIKLLLFIKTNYKMSVRCDSKS